MIARATLGLFTVCLLAWGATACGEGDAPDAGGAALGAATIVITIDLRAGRSWSAVGSAVDRGQICDAGSQALVDFLDLDGTPITLGEYARRRDVSLKAYPPDVTTDFVQMMQFNCSDGTGSFTFVVEERNGGPWSVLEGTGAYAGVTGSGTVEVVRDQHDHPDAPRGGVPRYDFLSGQIALAG